METYLIAELKKMNTPTSLDSQGTLTKKSSGGVGNSKPENPIVAFQSLDKNYPLDYYL